MHDLTQKKLFILDMDGTIYLGNRILPGAKDFIEGLERTGRDYVFFTNNASRTSLHYQDKLGRMGFKVKQGSVVTSGDVTARFLNERHPGSSVFLLGTPELKESFIERGIDITSLDPDIVVASFDLTLTYEKVRDACMYIRDGALFLATHMDLNCPTEDGFIPDCGSICALITASTGKKPRYLGKPFAETLEMIKSITGHDTKDMAVIGDRMYTDIAMGVKNRVASILVLTGETKRKDIENSDVKPDFVFENIGEAAEYISVL